MHYAYSVLSPTNRGIAIEQPPQTIFQFCEDLTQTVRDQPETLKKNECAALVVGTFENDERQGRHLKQASIIPADIDNKKGKFPPREVFIKALDDSGLAYWLCESASSTPQLRKYHLYLFLDIDLNSAQDFKAIYLSTLYKALPILEGHLDTAMQNPTQFMYIPNQAQLSSISQNPTGNTIPVEEPDPQIIKKSEAGIVLPVGFWEMEESWAWFGIYMN